MTRRWMIGSGLAMGLLLAGAASANPGTGMTFGLFFMWLYGNAVFGVLEGIGAAILGKAKIGRAVVLLVLGNYLTGFLGFFVMSWLIGLVQLMWSGEGMASAYAVTVTVAVLLYPVTILVEWPLFYLVCRWRPEPTKTLRRSFVACAVTNVITVSLMLWGYGSMSWMTLYTDLTEASPTELLSAYGVDDADLRVAYIMPPENGEQRLMLMQLDGTGAAEHSRYPVKGDRWYRRLELGFMDDPEDLVLRVGASSAIRDRMIDPTRVDEDEVLHAVSQGIVRATRPGPEREHGDALWLEGLDQSLSQWDAGSYEFAEAVSGLVYSRAGESGRRHLSFANPIYQREFAVKDVTVIADGLVLVKVGWLLAQHGKIALIDLEGKRIAWIGEGGSPVVVRVVEAESVP